MHRIFGKKSEFGRPIASSANFLNLALSQFEKSQLYVKTMHEYYWLFQVLIKIDEEITYYIIDSHLICRMALLAFNNKITSNENQTLNAHIPYTEAEIDLEYTKDMTVEPRRFKEEDFFKPSLSDLGSFYSLMWDILSQGDNQEVDDYSKFVFYQPGLEYTLSSMELKLFDINKEQINESFESISLENRKARQAICRIVAFNSYESIERSKESLKYISEELKDDKLLKRSQEYFKLISTLARINDQFQKKRVPLTLSYPVTSYRLTS